MSPELLKMFMDGELLSKIILWAGAIAGLLSASYAVALLIPGKQPDKAIKWLMDVTSILSRKKKPGVK